jgi:hypothetical protein
MPEAVAPTTQPAAVAAPAAPATPAAAQVDKKQQGKKKEKKKKEKKPQPKGYAQAEYIQERGAKFGAILVCSVRTLSLYCIVFLVWTCSIHCVIINSVESFAI